MVYGIDHSGGRFIIFWTKCPITPNQAIKAMTIRYTRAKPDFLFIIPYLIPNEFEFSLLSLKVAGVADKPLLII
jgi:hypothetical protein